MTIEQHQIFWPMALQITLTIAMFFVLAIRKAQQMKEGKIDRQKTALDNKAWCEDVVKVSNNIDNQFQTPVLYYAMCVALFGLNGVSMITLILAWGYALSRCVHAYIHIGSNHVPHRLPVFLFGCIMLMLMLISLFAKLIAT